MLAKIRATLLETDVRGTAVEAAWIIQGFKIEEKQCVIPPAEGGRLFYANAATI